MLKIIIKITSVILLLTSCNSQGDQQYENHKKPAFFKIHDTAITRNLEPFTATIGGFGNSMINSGSGFEPVIYRNKYIAQEDSDHRVVSNAIKMSYFDTLRDGFLDGASVNIYRIENGRFRLIRTGSIPDGGSHASGWLKVIEDRMVIPVQSTRFQYRWDTWSRPNVKYYFTVRAIDLSGNLSTPANVFSIDRPARIGRITPENAIVSFKSAKLSLDTTSPPPPTNLSGAVDLNGLLQLQWDPVTTDDIAGYIVYISDYPPEAQFGYYFDLSRSANSSDEPIKAGDMAIVSKKFYSASRNRYHSNRVWGAASENLLFMPGLLNFFPDEDQKFTWALLPHDTDTPVDEPGETYLKLTLNTFDKKGLGLYNHGGSDQDWYPVLEAEPYRIEVWLKSEQASNVQFKFSGFYDKPGHKIHPITFQVGPEWKKYVATFTPPVVQSGEAPNQMGLIFSGPGVFYVDNFRVFRADTGYLDYLPTEYANLKASGVSSLRTVGFIKTKFHTYDMDQLTNPGGVTDGTTKLNTLPQTLRMMRKAQIRPWLQIEPHMSPDEWGGLIEYLAAPYDPATDQPHTKPWAYKRYQQGQSKPWSDEFDKIYFELGNETWNQLFMPWTFNEMTDSATGERYSSGHVYGVYQEYVINLLKSSPYWKRAGLDNKVSFVLGGWNGMFYGVDAAAASPSSNYMTIAAYNGGWDEGEGPPGLDNASLFNVLNQVSQAAIPGAERHGKEVFELNSNRRRNLAIGTYEAGPGYAMSGLNGAKVTDVQTKEQEQVMKSLAAGTATIDSFLARAYRGFTLQNFFVFGAGSYWTSHAKWHKGGQAYPSWKQIELFNREATGSMLRTETISVPSVDLTAFERRQQINDAPLAAVYATRKGNRYSVYVISRKVADYPSLGNDGFTPVTLELPFRKVKSITLHKMAGSPHANNVADESVKIEKTRLSTANFTPRFTLNAKNGAHPNGLPPASTYLYVFEGCADFVKNRAASK